jgi:putative addiction module CopG family antidote
MRQIVALHNKYGLQARLSALSQGSDRIKSYSALEKRDKEIAMRTTQALSITLPLEMAQMVKSKVSSGEYASESEVIRDGLRALAARDAAVEKWLREEVVPTIQAHDVDPGRGLSVEETRKQLHAHMDVRSGQKTSRA